MHEENIDFRLLMQFKNSLFDSEDLVENHLIPLSTWKEIKEYDMILVDGPPGWKNSASHDKTIGRAGFLKHIDLFNTDVPIIIDDINRNPEMILLEKISVHLNKPYKILNDKVSGVIL